MLFLNSWLITTVSNAISEQLANSTVNSVISELLANYYRKHWSWLMTTVSSVTSEQLTNDYSKQCYF